MKIKNIFLETAKIEYKIKIATEEEICQHLKECDDNFFPHLSERVNIEEYSKKIVENSVTFEAWSENILIGLLATYINEKTYSAFITNVSILQKYRGLSISVELLSKCIEYVENSNFKEIKLEVHKKNFKAIGLYEKFNLIKYDSLGDLDLMKLEIK